MVQDESLDGVTEHVVADDDMSYVASASSSGKRTDGIIFLFGRSHALLSPYLVPQSIR